MRWRLLMRKQQQWCGSSSLSVFVFSMPHSKPADRTAPPNATEQNINADVKEAREAKQCIARTSNNDSLQQGSKCPLR